MSTEFKIRLRKAAYIFLLAGGASFLSMIVVQFFMGGIGDIVATLGKAFMIGVGMAMIVFLVPQSRGERYPWQ